MYTQRELFVTDNGSVAKKNIYTFSYNRRNNGSQSVNVFNNPISPKLSGNTENSKLKQTPYQQDVGGRVILKSAEPSLFTKEQAKALVDRVKVSVRMRIQPKTVKDELFQKLFNMKDSKGSFKFTSEQVENIVNSPIGIKNLTKILASFEGHQDFYDGEGMTFILTRSQLTPEIAKKSLKLVSEIETNPAFIDVKTGMGDYRGLYYQNFFEADTDMSKLPDNLKILKSLKNEPKGEFAKGMKPFDYIDILQQTKISAYQYKQLKESGIIDKTSNLMSILQSQRLSQKDLTNNIAFLQDVISHPDLSQFAQSQKGNPIPLLKLSIPKPIDFSKKRDVIDLINEIGSSPRYKEINERLSASAQLSLLTQDDLTFNDGLRLFDKLSSEKYMQGRGANPRERSYYMEKMFNENLNYVIKKYPLKKLEKTFERIQFSAKDYAPFAIENISDYGLAKVNKLLDITDYIKKHPVLSKAEICFDGIFEFLKSNIDSLDIEKHKPQFEMLADFVRQKENQNLFKYIGSSCFTDIMKGNKFSAENFRPENLAFFRELADSSDSKFILESVRPHQFESLLRVKDFDVELARKNLEIIKNLMKTEKYEILSRKDIFNFRLLMYEHDLESMIKKLDGAYKGLKVADLGNGSPSTNIFRYGVAYRSGGFSVSLRENSFDEGIGERVYAKFDKQGKKVFFENQSQKIQKGNVLFRETKIMDFRSNTAYLLEQQEKELVMSLNRMRTEQRTKDGRLIRGEVLTMSGVDGVFNIKTIDEKGKIHTISSAVKNSDGTIVSKDLRSLDGTRSRVNYRLSPDEKHSSYSYVISEGDGKVLASRSASAKKLNENEIEHVINSKKYKVVHSDGNLKITNMRTGFFQKIDLRKFIVDFNEDFEGLLKKLPADVLIKLKKKIKSIQYIQDMDSCIDRRKKEIYTAIDAAILNHEVGHELVNIERNTSGISGSVVLKSLKKLDFSKGTKLFEIYSKESNAINEKLPPTLREILDYFIDNTSVRAGLNETVAEAHSIVNGPIFNAKIAQRTHFLQQLFPKTIAYLMNNKFEMKNRLNIVRRLLNR